MRYVSLFSGIGCFEHGLSKSKLAGEMECVGFSEIDKPAIKIYTGHYPGHTDKALGNIEEIKSEQVPDCELIKAGFPCISLSILRGKRQHLQGKGSKLFYNTLDILEKKNPKYFLIENVASMSNDAKEEISAKLGVEPVMIDSVSLTGQSRRRLFWANFTITPPLIENPIDWRKVKLDDWYPELEISQSFYDKLFDDKGRPQFKFFNTDKRYEKQVLNGKAKNYLLAYSRSTRYPKEKPSYAEHRIRIDRTANCLTGGKGCGSFSSMNLVMNGKRLRYLHPIEAERLQGLSDNYTEGVSLSSRYRTVGKGLSAEVARHIFDCLHGVENAQ